MEGKGIKVFGVVMALLLVFSLAATLSVSSTVSAGTQKWTKISIPGTDDMQLAPGTDVGAIAVSPDGATLFAAVINQSTEVWNVYKSVDDGYTWKVTGWQSDIGVSEPANDIVAIKVSPDWDNDTTVVVATNGNISYSDDGGKTFNTISLSGVNLGTGITCMDVALDEDGDLVYGIGTGGAAGEVYLLSGLAGWVAQKIENPDSSAGSAYSFVGGVLAMAFSPNFGEDDTVFAIVEGTAPMDAGGEGTHLRAETDTTVHNWGSFIQDAHFIDTTTVPNCYLQATRASMAFADDFNSVPAVFVGLVANTWDAPLGDAFRVDLVKGSIGASPAEDLDILNPNTGINVYSIDVAGPASSAYILAGINELSNDGPMSTWQGQVHYSANGGETWLQSYKPPSGMSVKETAATVLMAPGFDPSDEAAKAYCSNGYLGRSADLTFSGFYVSTTFGTTWNGRGLLDHTIDSTRGDCIEDIVPSPDYDNDSTLFMVTNSSTSPTTKIGLLWETKDGGSKWELILGMTTMIPLPGVHIDKIAIPATYPDEPEIFVAGRLAVAPASPTGLIVRSTDEGNLFATTLKAPYDAAVPQVIDSWVVFDQNTLIVASGSNIWKTTDMGAHWKLPTMADIDTAAGERIMDMQQYKDTNTLLVGTDRGNMFICQDWLADFSFTEIGNSPLAAGDTIHVAFDANFDENGFVYAGSASATASHRGVWRADVNSDDTWDQIDGHETIPVACGNVSSIATDGNGILWALCSASTCIRSVNPAEPLYDEVVFEQEITGLGGTVIFKDLETAPTQTYVFAIGGDATYPTELWAYIDTLIKPTLISPACGSTATGTIIQGSSLARVSLMWEDMPKATEYEYQVAYDDAFGSIAVDDTTNGGTQASVQLYLGEKYYWRVRAITPVYSQWSETCDFTTPLGPASAKPVITYPGSQDSHTNIELTPSLTWTSTVEATGFELVLAANCDWSNPVIDMTGSNALVGPDTCYAITQALQQGTNYCWKVRAINSDTDTMSPWSDTGTFTTMVVEVEEEEGTPMWVWVVIALSAVLLVGVVVLIIRTRRPV